jgi:hypothetical protein
MIMDVSGRLVILAFFFLRHAVAVHERRVVVLVAVIVRPMLKLAERATKVMV